TWYWFACNLIVKILFVVNVNTNSKKFYGPFCITERIGQVAYRLELPEGSRIHSVFHVSNLKPYRGPIVTPSSELPAESFENQPVETPLAIAATHTVLLNGVPLQQVLVQWDGCSPNEASWEDWEHFHTIFPSVHLEDKVIFEEGGNDTSPIQSITKKLNSEVEV
ncbi:hypothetical protein A2U01_0050540, partial [Trifolium medium]|nr:hypothetical protein [Trifolium medium]